MAVTYYHSHQTGTQRRVTFTLAHPNFFFLIVYPPTFFPSYSTYLSAPLLTCTVLLFFKALFMLSLTLVSQFSVFVVTVLTLPYRSTAFSLSLHPIFASITWSCTFASPKPLHPSLSDLALRYDPCLSFRVCSKKKTTLSPFLRLHKCALFVFPSAPLLCFATSRQSCWQRWARAYLKCHWKSDKRSHGK